MKELGEISGPLLIFGGPYGNLAATQSIFEVASQHSISPSHVICTGDLVAYCAEPAETVSLIQEWGCHVVMGNCEESLAAGADNCGCGFDEGSACSVLSAEWYLHASTHVPIQQKNWMANLPSQISFTLQGKRFRVVHGSVESINEFIFAGTDNLVKTQQLNNANSDIVIGGHCGIPFGQTLENGYWLNAGVIGMPANDGASTGWYMLLEPTEEGIKASWHQLKYPVTKTVEAMAKAQLCQPYAKALISGLWPSLDVLPEPERLQTGKRLDLPTMRLL